MPVGPFGELLPAAYIADDGNTYAIGVPDYVKQAALLGDPLPGTLPYPALWLTRYLACVQSRGEPLEPALRAVHVPVNKTHFGWTIGPGTHLLINGVEYQITLCRGERRVD